MILSSAVTPVATLLLLTFQAPPPHHDFSVRAADGTMITGAVDAPAGIPHGTVIIVPGTGLSDRDGYREITGARTGLDFRDLARRLTGRGFAVVRYDKRGTVYRREGSKVDPEVVGSTSVATQVEDLRAVLEYARRQASSGTCLALLAHSEGMATVGRMAQGGVPPPDLVIGIGAMMESPVSLLRWQLAEREVEAIRSMDANGDGITSNAEIANGWKLSRAGWRADPATLQSVNGGWTSGSLAALAGAQRRRYEEMKAVALSHGDNDIYPGKFFPIARYSWWKNWFTDDIAIAQRLRAWHVPVYLHYGSRDSQVPIPRQIQAARLYLGGNVTVHLHDGLGHALGPDPLNGPLADSAGDLIGTEIAGCGERSAV